MTEQLSLQAQVIYILLFLGFFSLGVAQLFFVHRIREHLLHLRHYLEKVYGQYPLLLNAIRTTAQKVNAPGIHCKKADSRGDPHNHIDRVSDQRLPPARPMRLLENDTMREATSISPALRTLI